MPHVPEWSSGVFYPCPPPRETLSHMESLLKKQQQKSLNDWEHAIPECEFKLHRRPGHTLQKHLLTSWNMRKGAGTRLQGQGEKVLEGVMNGSPAYLPRCQLPTKAQLL